jgi:hypothetical protein
MNMPEEAPQYRDMMNRLRAESRESEEGLIKRQLNKVEEDPQNLLARQQSELQGDQALGQALSRRNKRGYDVAFSDLNRQLKLDAPSYRMARLKAATGAISKEGAIQRLAQNTATQNELERYKSRQQTITNVLNVTGAVAGAYLGGAGAGGTTSTAIQGASVGGSIGGKSYY